MNNIQLKPFIKWAGGKSQLLESIRKKYPDKLGTDINKYAEPFVGGGAVLFDILSKYKLKSIYISDINCELINTYKVIRDNIGDLILSLSNIEEQYLDADLEKRRLYYYEKRQRFNKLKADNCPDNNIEKAALFIFLNKTCFNGLYRVNKKGQFNVPMGSYKRPLICDAENLRNISSALKDVVIVCADYKESSEFIDENTFVYFDPPYRPLTDTAKFTAYSENIFDDKSQKELAGYIKLLDEKGARVIVSNSDPKNEIENDNFFDELYKEYKINRVQASRAISCNGGSRGKINELLITNY